MHADVLSASPVTPTMVRVVLGGGDLAGLEVPEATDAYINVALPPDGAPYDGVFDPGEMKARHPAGGVAGAPSLHRAGVGRRRAAS